MNVITESFVGASDLQLDALGFDGATVVVAHPIQNLTTAELHALADTATDRIVAAIVTRHDGWRTNDVQASEEPR